VSVDVIDTQVHFNRDFGVDTSMAAMDAVGVDAVLVDEWAGFDSHGHPRPYRLIRGGIVRSEYPYSLEAVRRYPGRVCYMARIDHRDPEVDDLVADVAGNPHQLCLRVAPKEPTGQLEAFTTGGYDRLLSAAERHGVPIMLWVPTALDHAAAVARRYSGLGIVMDHCGILPLPRGAQVDGFPFGAVAALAEFPNVSVKISHLPALSRVGFPFPDVVPHVRRLIDCFGMRRVMWASDFTQTRLSHSWSEALLYLNATNRVSLEEKRWIFAETARSVLNWPAAPSFGVHRVVESRIGGGLT
jgi:L-fuconolactonase